RIIIIYISDHLLFSHLNMHSPGIFQRNFHSFHCCWHFGTGQIITDQYVKRIYRQIIIINPADYGIVTVILISFHFNRPYAESENNNQSCKRKYTDSPEQYWQYFSLSVLFFFHPNSSLRPILPDGTHSTQAPFQRAE